MGLGAVGAKAKTNLCQTLIRQTLIRFAPGQQQAGVWFGAGEPFWLKVHAMSR